MDGVAPLLNSRIMQLIESGNGLVLNFRLLNLIAFYDTTMQKLELGTSSLGHVLVESRAQCQRTFELGLRNAGESALASPPAYTMDLSVRPCVLSLQIASKHRCSYFFLSSLHLSQAAPLVSDAGRQLSEILQVYEASLIPADSLGYALDDILTALIEPILRACRLGSEGIDPSDAAVFMLNNATALQVSRHIDPKRKS